MYAVRDLIFENMLSNEFAQELLYAAECMSGDSFIQDINKVLNEIKRTHSKEVKHFGFNMNSYSEAQIQIARSMHDGCKSAINYMKKALQSRLETLKVESIIKDIELELEQKIGTQYINLVLARNNNEKAEYAKTAFEELCFTSWKTAKVCKKVSELDSLSKKNNAILSDFISIIKSTKN